MRRVVDALEAGPGIRSAGQHTRDGIGRCRGAKDAAARMRARRMDHLLDRRMTVHRASTVVNGLAPSGRGSRKAGKQRHTCLGQQLWRSMMTDGASNPRTNWIVFVVASLYLVVQAFWRFTMRAGEWPPAMMRNLEIGIDVAMSVAIVALFLSSRTIRRGRASRRFSSFSPSRRWSSSLAFACPAMSAGGRAIGGTGWTDATGRRPARTDRMMDDAVGDDGDNPYARRSVIPGFPASR